MADVSITPANVQHQSSATLKDAITGAVIDAGEPIYLDVAGLALLADASAVLTAAAVGIAVNSAGLGQPIRYQTGGELDLGTALTEGDPYWVSLVGGGISPTGDVDALNAYLTLLGVGNASGFLDMNVFASGSISATP